MKVDFDIEKPLHQDPQISKMLIINNKFLTEYEKKSIFNN